MTRTKGDRQDWMMVIACVVALAAAGLPPWPARAAPVTQDAYRIVVLAFPDLAGNGPKAPECLGCDGRFSTADALRGREDGLPAVRVILRDKDGKEIDSATTEALPNGRQSVTFEVDDRGTYQVELESEPSGWSLCPGGGRTADLTKDDFDRDTKTARVQFGFWRECAAATAVPTSGPTAIPTAELLTPAQATVVMSPTVVPSELQATAVPTALASGTVAAAQMVGTPATPLPAPTPGMPMMPTSGSIVGTVFLDANRDGLAASFEEGVPDVVVSLAGTNVSLTAQSGATGVFRFENLAPGTYEVSLEVPAGYMLTTTDRYASVTVAHDQVVGVDFGLVPRVSAEPPAQPVVPALPGTGAALPGTGSWLFSLAILAGLIGVLGAAADRRFRTHECSADRKDG